MVAVDSLARVEVVALEAPLAWVEVAVSEAPLAWVQVVVEALLRLLALPHPQAPLRPLGPVLESGVVGSDPIHQRRHPLRSNLR